MAGIRDFGDEDETDTFGISSRPRSLDLKVMNVEYTEHQSRPITHLFCRDEDREHYHIEVSGHRPSFFIREEAHTERIDNHYAVEKTESVDNEGKPYKNLYGERLVRVYTHLPDQISEMRELFDDHYEADVFYVNRFLIDNDIYNGVSIDLTDAKTDDWLSGDYRVDMTAVEPRSRDATPGVNPKKMVFDIEVASDSEVPDTNKAKYPVTTIVAWDNYDEQYVGWLLEPEEKNIDIGDDVLEQAELDMLGIYQDESEMLHDFNTWVSDKRPDIITGWYSNNFDIPYLVNRCRELNTWNYQDWSPLNEVYLGNWEPRVKGSSCVDMIDAYKKTQIHKLKAKGLDDIAEKELGEGKVDHELDHTEMWEQKPLEFLRYNKVDVELVHKIDEAAGATDLLDNLRAVVGCSYSDPLGGNIDMMDILFLRRAKEYGYVLPTAEKPDKDWYYGAKVFEPTAGISTDVVYLDVSSLYPSLIKQLNISPETIREEKPPEPYAKSYIDTRPDSNKKDSEPDMDPIYYDRGEDGFVASLVDELIELKNEYRGTGMYEAVKRITNSVYGVLSDSDSYSKGFRLFDWRMGESICLAGRLVVTKSSELALEWSRNNGYEDAFIKMGDTDGFGVSLPSAETQEEALRAGFEMEKYINENIAEECTKMFEIDETENEIELECESYATRVFVKGEDDGHSDVGVRKKYTQKVVWEQ